MVLRGFGRQLSHDLGRALELLEVLLVRVREVLDLLGGVRLVLPEKLLLLFKVAFNCADPVSGSGERDES